ncbi:MAG TPA: S9 family peptidase, partial [Porphyromonadaceae bacterium]|nr:S9 family peptidase [Porphyromonadaceae bacterium]
MRKYFIFLLLSVCTSLLFAQQNKLFTLDELIPGGKNFYSYYPQIGEQFQWHDDELMMLRDDSVFRVDPLNPNHKKFVFRFDEIRKKEKGGGIVSRVSFDREGSDNLVFSSAKGTGVYDLKTRQVILSVDFPENSANQELSPDNVYLAYTKENNLYITDGTGKETAITSEENKGIVCGQAVHRDEFGIKGGIFWSPGGNKLAFYRMDETMVASYPVVDISARTATEKSIRYPMAGESSHEVAIGVYNVKTG